MSIATTPNPAAYPTWLRIDTAVLFLTEEQKKQHLDEFIKCIAVGKIRCQIFRLTPKAPKHLHINAADFNAWRDAK